MSSVCYLRRVSVRNKLDKVIKNVRVKYGQGDKDTGVWFYMWQWSIANIENGRNILHTELVEIGDIQVGEDKSVKHDIKFYTDKRGYWQVYFDYDGKSCKINKNNAMVNPWRQDNEKYVEITIRNEGSSKIRIEFDMDSGRAYFYANKST